MREVRHGRQERSPSNSARQARGLTNSRSNRPQPLVTTTPPHPPRASKRHARKETWTGVLHCCGRRLLSHTRAAMEARPLVTPSATRGQRRIRRATLHLLGSGGSKPAVLQDEHGDPLRLPHRNRNWLYWWQSGQGNRIMTPRSRPARLTHHQYKALPAQPQDAAQSPLVQIYAAHLEKSMIRVETQHSLARLRGGHLFIQRRSFAL